jgi:AbrB family looped-hinge helix DNA binding protein
MPSATVTSKGQITIPLEVRNAMGVSAGTRIDFVRGDDGRYVMIPKTGSISALKGIIPLRRKPATIEEMQEAIVAGATKGIRPRAAKRK